MGSTPPSGVVGVALIGSTVGGDVHATVYVDARARRAAAAVMAVRPDPDADAGFVGRAHELVQLLDLLASHSATGPPIADSTAGSSTGAGGGETGVVVVSAVAGAPGVGKTALAQAAARAAVARGWFPGGAVTVDLQGYDPDPDQVVWPAQLYAGLLRVLGVPGEDIPPDEVGQATAYHQILDQLTAAGRPVLLVLDNVGDADQVADVLPHGVGAHRVLITSRDSMARLPQARLVDLHILDPAEAVQLLDLGMRWRHPGDGRVAGEPAATAHLVELCGRLPLAVQIVAALLADEPDRPLAEMVTELVDEQHRLGGLAYDGRWAVRTAFDLSYRRLDPARAKLFALLAVVPGPDVGLAVAAAAADRDQPTTRSGLRALCRAHLLDQQPVQPEAWGPRWRMHDLLRLYAAEQLTPDQRTGGFDRVLSHYRHTADLAARRFTALPADVAAVPAGFDTPAQAMGWVRTERTGLIACVTQAADSHPEDAMFLAADLAPFLDRARLFTDWVTVAAAAVQATRGTTDPTVAAGSWGNLGIALREVRRFDEAITAQQRAGDLFREAGDRHSEAMTWSNLGNVLRAVQRFDEAITAHQRAGDLAREAGDRHGEAMTVIGLGNALREARRFDEAITVLEDAREIYRETGDRHSEGQAEKILGSVLREMRRFDEAITALEHAREVFQETGDHYREGEAETSLGVALREVRRFDEAITAQQRAGDLFREAGDRHGEAVTWSNLGNVLRAVQRFDEAITAHQRAGDLAREAGDRHGEGTAQYNLGLVLTAVGRFDEAIIALEHAREIFRDAGDRHREAMTVIGLGNALRGMRQFDEAITALEHAEELYRETGDRHGEGTARASLGVALGQARRFDEAISACGQAIAIYVEFGDDYEQARTLTILGQVYLDLNALERARHAWTDAAALFATVSAADDAAQIRQRIADLDR